MDLKNFVIIGGGTVSHVRNHLALCAPAYGSTARKLNTLFRQKLGVAGAEASLREYGYWPADQKEDVKLYLTKMAGKDELAVESNLETNKDVSKLVDQLIADPNTKVIIFNPALVDFDGSVCESGAVGYDWYNDIETYSGKYAERLKTSSGRRLMALHPSEKIINKIRKERKDIFLVAFKTTCNVSQDEQFLRGLHLLKTNSCNLVVANDTGTRVNMIITPEQARYCVTTDRDKVLEQLAEMTIARSQGTFTHTNTKPGAHLPWHDQSVPKSLRMVVDYCIEKGAYKPFNGSTVGHFAVKLTEDTFLTSARKVDFNKLKDIGMVFCRAEDDGTVTTYHSKPSVGGQSQRIIFKEHPEMDCIVHFHCPMRQHALSHIVQHQIPVRDQTPYECGSHQCGQNTSSGLEEVAEGIKCVYLDNHGPNIVFNRNIDPQKVIMFIERNFDLSKSTDGIDRTKPTSLGGVTINW